MRSRKPYPRFHCGHCRKVSYGTKNCVHCYKEPRRGSIEDEKGNFSRPSVFDGVKKTFCVRCGGTILGTDKDGVVCEYCKTDNVNHPSHYTAGKVECIDAIEAATSGLEGIQAVCTGNVIKYIWRWRRKNGVEDLRKARWYLDKLIESEEVEQG